MKIEEDVSTIKQVDIEPNSLHEQVDIAASLGCHFRGQRFALLKSLHDSIPRKNFVSDISQSERESLLT